MEVDVFEEEDMSSKKRKMIPGIKQETEGSLPKKKQRYQQPTHVQEKDYSTNFASSMTGAGNTGPKDFGLTREEHNEIAHARNHERKEGEPKKSSDENEDESEGEQKNERAGSSSGPSSADLGAADVEDWGGISPFSGINMRAGLEKWIAPESRVAGINSAGSKNAKDKLSAAELVSITKASSSSEDKKFAFRGSGASGVMKGSEIKPPTKNFGTNGKELLLPPINEDKEELFDDLHNVNPHDMEDGFGLMGDDMSTRFGLGRVSVGWDGNGLAYPHRTGFVPVCETSTRLTVLVSHTGDESPAIKYIWRRAILNENRTRNAKSNKNNELMNLSLPSPGEALQGDRHRRQVELRFPAVPGRMVLVRRGLTVAPRFNSCTTTPIAIIKTSND